ncbi:MAG: DUF1828 domain-containing protein [Candidatus Neomarinimicrobiota bacterium]|jgi:hypothetical protein
MSIQEEITRYLNPNFGLIEKRVGIFQLIAPFYHEDGDMVEIYLEPLNQLNRVKISDFGMTIMRLSYSFDVDTPNKEKIFNRIIDSNQLSIRDGELYLETDVNSLQNSIFQFAQTIGKISNMALYQREVIQNLFFEMLDQYVDENLSNYYPQKNFYPIPGHDEYMVDYCFNHSQRPIYLFGVNSQSNARLVTISCLKFLQEKMPFKSVVVLESIDVMSRKDIARLMSVADKQFPDLDDFRNNSVEYFSREYNSK